MKIKEHLFLYDLRLIPNFNDSEKWSGDTYTTNQAHSEFLGNLG